VRHRAFLRARVTFLTVKTQAWRCNHQPTAKKFLFAHWVRINFIATHIYQDYITIVIYINFEFLLLISGIFLTEIDAPEIDYKKLDSLNSWSRKDVVEWFSQYGADKESLEKINFTNFSHLYQILNGDIEGSAKRLNMGTATLQRAIDSFHASNPQSSGYMSAADHMYTNGKNLKLQIIPKIL